MREEFDGKIESKDVKIIIKKIKDGIKELFAKPKKKDIETPHFYEKNGELEVHQDSADGTMYRIAEKIYYLGTVTLPPGVTTIQTNSKHASMAIPVNTKDIGFNMFNVSGAACFTLNSESSVLMADCKWGDWKRKDSKVI